MKNRIWPFEHGIGLGGWLTNYKKIVDLPEQWKYVLTKGDFEHFDRYISEKDVKNIASLGMDHIRMCFDQFVMEDEPFHYREAMFRKLDDFIFWCEKYKVGVVLNLHRAYGNAHDDAHPAVHLVDDPALQERFIALWLECEKRWHGKPELVFEPMNEPVDIDPGKWNDLMTRFIAAIRKLNPTRRVVIGCTCWSLPHTLPKLKVFDDEYVIYTFHFYAPHIFTHQRVQSMPAQRFYDRHVPYPGGLDEYYRDFERVVSGSQNAFPGLKEMDIEFLRQEMQPAFDFRKAHPDKVLWLGEFGSTALADQKSRDAWMHDVILLAKEHGISFCSWDYISSQNIIGFQLCDPKTRKILSPELAKIILGKVGKNRAKS